jgi:hypothetical protein
MMPEAQAGLFKRDRDDVIPELDHGGGAKKRSGNSHSSKVSQSKPERMKTTKATKATKTSGKHLGDGHVVRAVGAGLGRILMASAKTIAILACGLTALPLDFALHQVRKLIWNHKVECQNGQYVSVDYDGFFGKIKEDYASKREKKPGDSLSKKIDAAFSAICVAPVKRLIKPKSEASRANYHDVPVSTLNQVFSAGAPACTKENAKKVQAHIRKNLEGAEQSMLGLNGPERRSSVRRSYAGPSTSGKSHKVRAAD